MTLNFLYEETKDILTNFHIFDTTFWMQEIELGIEETLSAIFFIKTPHFDCCFLSLA